MPEVKGGARRVAAAFGIAAVLGVVTACGGPTTPVPSPTTARPSPPTTPTASGGGSVAPSGRTVATATLAGCPAPQALDRLPVLHRFNTDADDVAVDAAGHIWVSSPGGGRIDELSSGGVEMRSFANVNEPEGLVALADGRIAVAEQRTNRVVILDPATGATALLVSVANPSGNLGMDDLGLSGDGRGLLIPDSPSGRLLEVPLSGGEPVVLATGLGRPVDANPLPDGSIAVASEDSPGLRVVAPSGAVRTLGSASDLDEAVPDGGLIYVTSLGAGEVLAVDPSSGATRVLVTDAPSPQGLSLLPDGRLLLVDSTRRVAVELRPCA